LPPLPQKQTNPDEHALDEDDSQLSIFEAENIGENESNENDDTITTTVGDIIEQATAD
jgi:hypothetical protein